MAEKMGSRRLWYGLLLAKLQVTSGKGDSILLRETIGITMLECEFAMLEALAHPVERNPAEVQIVGT